MGDVAPTDALERGRADYDRRAWLDAFTALSEADRRNPLVAADLEMLAMAAMLVRHHDVAVQGLARAHAGYLAAGDVPAAARCAIMIGLEFMNLGEAARANGWFSRATKTPLFAAGSLAGNPLFQHQLATADTRLRAARALLYEDAASAWATATARHEFTLDQRARIRAAGVWVTATAARVVDFCYRAGGGGAVYLDNPLQRRLRDINTVTQHFLVRSDTLTTAGAVLAGQDPALPIF